MMNCIFFLILFNGCQKYSVNKVPYETTEQEVYTDYEYSTKTIKVPVYNSYAVSVYQLKPPYFPYIENRNIKIAVLPFTDSSPDKSNKAGLEIAEEIEYELIKRIEKWQKKNPDEIKNEMYKFTDESRFAGISRIDIDNWYANNKRTLYEVVNRTELSMILKEADITSENYVNKLRKNITAIDGLIVGHVKELSQSYASFIVKCVDVRTSKIIFTQRYEGIYRETVDDFVDAFFYNIVKTDDYVIKESVSYKDSTYQEKIPVQKTRTVTVTKYREEEGGYTLAYIVSFVLIVGLIAWLAN